MKALKNKLIQVGRQPILHQVQFVVVVALAGAIIGWAFNQPLASVAALAGALVTFGCGNILARLNT